MAAPTVLTSNNRNSEIITARLRRGGLTMPRLVLAIVIGVLVAIGGAYATHNVLNAKPDSGSLYSYGGS